MRVRFAAHHFVAYYIEVTPLRGVCLNYNLMGALDVNLDPFSHMF